MNCPNCGNQIPDGTLFCTACGSPVPSQPAAPQQPTQPQQFAQPQQPTQPTQPQQFAQPQQPTQPQQFAQPQGQPQQFGGQPGYGGQPGFGGQPGMPGQPGAPAFNGAGINGFMTKMKAEPIRWAEVAGLVLIFLGTVIQKWVTVSMFGFSESAGLFKGSGGFWVIVGLIYLIATVFMALMMLDVVPALNGVFMKYKAIPFSQFYYAGFVFLTWLLYFIINAGDIHDLGSYASFGFAFWITLIGAIAAAVVPVMKFIKKENYWA